MVKVALFRSLFRGREDVYAERWRMRDGDCGYRPAGLKNWEAGVVIGRTPRTTCTRPPFGKETADLSSDFAKELAVEGGRDEPVIQRINRRPRFAA